MEQEVGYLCACFGVPDEEEAVAKARRKAKTWLRKAHESVEQARERIGSHLRKVLGADKTQQGPILNLELPHFC